jgi:hypothetical protein
MMPSGTRIACALLAGGWLAAAPAAAGGLQLMAGGEVVADGGAWHIPQNSAAAEVALFSEQRQAFSIHNDGAGPLTVEAIALERGEGVLDEEYSLQTAAPQPQLLDLRPIAIAPGKSFDFTVRYTPVQSRSAAAELVITYDGGKKHSVELTGSGSGAAVLAAGLDTRVHKLFGGKASDERVTGMVADDQGNVFFAGQVTGVADEFAYDLFFGKISAAGELAWARLWHGPHRDYTRDPGQNDASGGAANAIDIDAAGDVYLCGSVSPSRYNNNFAALVLKIDGDDGAIVWEKLWRPAWPERLLAKHGADAYGLDEHDGHVYVTGTTGAARENANALVLFLSLAAADGTIEFQRTVEPTPETTDRGYSVRAGEQGQVYLGGLKAKTSLLLRFDGAGGGAPELAWARVLETGWGSHINDLAVDAAGGVFAAIDRRGARCAFSFAKLTPAGELAWARTYQGAAGNENHNISFVELVGDALWTGGRIGLDAYDAQMGDGLLLAVDAAAGELRDSFFYYSGKGPEAIAAHRIKGLARRGQTLHVLGQVTTGSQNVQRYWGHWYAGASQLVDYRPAVEPLALDAEAVRDIPAGAVRDASDARELIDLSGRLEFQTAPDKTDGESPDADLIYWQLELD